MLHLMSGRGLAIQRRLDKGRYPLEAPEADWQFATKPGHSEIRSL